jgi:glycerol-3-phosphate dehydrogenase
MTLFSILSSAKQYITTDTGSLEINKMALDSAMQAIIYFQKNHESNQLMLSGEVEDIWHSAGTGAAFCEMARSFVAEFTEKQLRYFIEREAARSINDFGLLKTFSETLSKQTVAISNHALEISKLMQSFSAGWFNLHSVSALPSGEQLKSFIDYSFHKMREEFRREADDQ